MIKITFLCIIITIGYIHCNSTNNTNLPINLSTIDVKQIDIKEQNQLKFLASLNLSQIRPTRSDNKPIDLSGYYNWLNFLKTSTSTQGNNATMPAETI